MGRIELEKMDPLIVKVFCSISILICTSSVAILRVAGPRIAHRRVSIHDDGKIVIRDSTADTIAVLPSDLVFVSTRRLNNHTWLPNKLGCRPK